MLDRWVRVRFMEAFSYVGENSMLIELMFGPEGDRAMSIPVKNMGLHVLMGLDLNQFDTTLRPFAGRPPEDSEYWTWMDGDYFVCQGSESFTDADFMPMVHEYALLSEVRVIAYDPDGRVAWDSRAEQELAELYDLDEELNQDYESWYDELDSYYPDLE